MNYTDELNQLLVKVFKGQEIPHNPDLLRVLLEDKLEEAKDNTFYLKREGSINISAKELSVYRDIDKAHNLLMESYMKELV